ncbi:agamous-like MADS-box protein AGL62 [Tanacetum coccineum]
MAIIVQSPGGHCYAFGHPSVDVVIDRYENNGSTLVSPKHPSVTELNMQYAELEKELEREKRKYEMIQQEKKGKSSSSEFVPWYEQDIEWMEVEELEQYVAALVELKRKVFVRAGDLVIWGMYGIKVHNNTLNGPTNGLNFGEGIKIQNNSMNGPTNGLGFRDGINLDFGDGIKFVSNTMNGLTNGLDFGDGNNHENNTMNGPTSHQYFGDGIKIWNNKMNGPTSHQHFRDGSMIGSNTMNGPTNGLDFGDGIKIGNNTMNGPTSFYGSTVQNGQTTRLMLIQTVASEGIQDTGAIASSSDLFLMGQKIGKEQEKKGNDKDEGDGVRSRNKFEVLNGMDTDNEELDILKGGMIVDQLEINKLKNMKDGNEDIKDVLEANSGIAKDLSTKELEGTLPMKYLGIPLITKNIGISECNQLVERVKQKASVFLIPKTTVKDIEKALKGFLGCHGDLKKGAAKVAWKVICAPKSQGGLGIKRLGP